jgi:hypothetical protein
VVAALTVRDSTCRMETVAPARGLPSEPVTCPPRAAVVFCANAGATNTTTAAALTAVLENTWKRELDTQDLLKLKLVAVLGAV